MIAFPKLAARCAAVLSFHLLAILPLRAAVDLKLDFNDRVENTPALTEGGFTTMAMTASPTSGTTSATFGAQTVTITSSVPGTVTYDDRRRPAPLNTGNFTQQALLQDFIFCAYNAAHTTSGIDVTVEGLEAGRLYVITVWSFDATSTGTRVSDWSANGVLKVSNYTFGGATLPATNERYQMNFQSTANGSGQVIISARRDTTSLSSGGAAEAGVFLNALRVRAYDSDDDQMDDDWETAHGLIVGVNDAALNPDQDGPTNLEEFTANSDPRDPDTDDDSLLDGAENNSGTWGGAANPGTSPIKADTDADGLGDAVENPDLPWLSPVQPGTNPNIQDTDGDTFADGDEAYWAGRPRDDVVLPDVDSSSTLAVDFDHSAVVLQPGFVSLPGTGVAGTTSLSGTFGPRIVTVTAVGTTTIDSRDRTATSAAGGFTSLFQDFIFSPTSGDDGDGMDVTISGLAPLTWYPVTLWSWDPSSASSPRHSTWLASNGDNGPVVKVSRYILTGTTPVPASLSQRRMKFDALTDSAGRLVIQGRKEPGFLASAINVFLNGFAIGPPVTPLRFTSPAGPQFTFASDDIATYEVFSSQNLLQWLNIAPAVDGSAGTTTFTDPAGLTRRFYQVRRVSP